jgi:hypothetical protein
MTPLALRERAAAKTRDAIKAKKEAVFAILVEAARHNRPCPSNVVLAQALGVSAWSTAHNYMKRLAAEGRIVIHSGVNERVVVIPSLGIQTAGRRPC